jgi:hypothetical protein
MTRGSEWGVQIAWLVVQKWLILGKDPAEIEEDLLPCGPRRTAVYDILKRFRDGVQLTGRRVQRRASTILGAEQRLALLRIVNLNPTKFLDEIQRGMFLLAGVRVSVSHLCCTLNQMGLTRRKVRSPAPRSYRAYVSLQHTTTTTTNNTDTN